MACGRRGDGERGLTVPTFSHICRRAQGGSALPPGGRSLPEGERPGRRARPDPGGWASPNAAAARIRACGAGDPGAREGGLVWPSRADLLPPDAPRQ